MPDHIHLIAEGKDLGKHISSFKSFTARQIINTLESENKVYELDALEKAKLAHKTDRKYQVWTEGFHPKQIRTDQMMNQKIEYIHYNPVKANLISKELAWEHSSAQYYIGEDCSLSLTLFGDWGAPTQSIGAR
jgi:REP element-mobilizing transposase RayT